jgi:hypothetical protein
MSSIKADYPSPESFTHAAWVLDCEVAAIRAVARVEASTIGAFLDSGEPTLLYERHLFHRFTDGHYDGIAASGLPPTHALLSSRTPGGYGPVSAQHARLQAAVELDRNAALRACSWGLFQILGDNWRRAGHDSLQSFVSAMYRDADEHLRAFVFFVHSDPRLLAALRAKDWPTVASKYNGAAYKRLPRPHYDERMAAAFDALTEEA